MVHLMKIWEESDTYHIFIVTLSATTQSHMCLAFI